MSYTTSLRLLVASHLSDIAFEMSFTPTVAWARIEFVKYLTIEYSDMTLEVNPDAEWTRFLEACPYVKDELNRKANEI